MGYISKMSRITDQRNQSGKLHLSIPDDLSGSHVNNTHEEKSDPLLLYKNPDRHGSSKVSHLSMLTGNGGMMVPFRPLSQGFFDRYIKRISFSLLDFATQVQAAKMVLLASHKNVKIYKRKKSNAGSSLDSSGATFVSEESSLSSEEGDGDNLPSIQSPGEVTPSDFWSKDQGYSQRLVSLNGEEASGVVTTRVAINMTKGKQRHIARRFLKNSCL